MHFTGGLQLGNGYMKTGGLVGTKSPVNNINVSLS